MEIIREEYHWTVYFSQSSDQLKHHRKVQLFFSPSSDQLKHHRKVQLFLSCASLTWKLSSLLSMMSLNPISHLKAELSLVGDELESNLSPEIWAPSCLCGAWIQSLTWKLAPSCRWWAWIQSLTWKLSSLLSITSLNPISHLKAELHLVDDQLEFNLSPESWALSCRWRAWIQSLRCLWCGLGCGECPPRSDWSQHPGFCISIKNRTQTPRILRTHCKN